VFRSGLVEHGFGHRPVKQHRRQRLIGCELFGDWAKIMVPTAINLGQSLQNDLSGHGCRTNVDEELKSGEYILVLDGSFGRPHRRRMGSFSREMPHIVAEVLQTELSHHPVPSHRLGVILTIKSRQSGDADVDRTLFTTQPSTIPSIKPLQCFSGASRLQHPCRNLDGTTLRESGLLDRRDKRVRIAFGIGDLGQSANKPIRIVIDPVRR
jgi:hypothetical protein